MALMDSREENLSRAVSASSRRKILRLLVGQELTVKEIAAKKWSIHFLNITAFDIPS